MLEHPLVMGQGHIKSIQTLGQTSGNTAITIIKKQKNFDVVSEFFYWKQVYFQVFDGTSTKKEIAPTSDWSGSIQKHSKIRSDNRQRWHYGHLGATIFVAFSESLYWKQAYFKVFDGTSVERAMAAPSDGSGHFKSIQT